MRTHRKLFVEGLENRAMLAGNVTAYVDGGTLFIVGNLGGNGVSVEQIDNGRYFVTGFNVGGNTRVNGNLNGRIFSGVTNDINVDLNEGNDVFVMSNRATRRAELAAELSGGTAGPIPASPEPANPATVAPGLTRVPRHLYINTDEGSDGVGFTARVGSNDLNGGARTGGDAVINTGINGDRVIALNSTVFDDLLIYTSDGTDTVQTPGTGTYGLLFADLGAGNDTFQSRDNWGFHSQIYGGAGDDLLEVDNYDFTEEVFLNGGSGASTINANGVRAGHISVISGAGSDLISLTNSRSFNNLIVDTGEGNDDVTLNNADADDLLAAYLGGGNDDLRISNTSTGDTHLDGGAGFDNFDNNGGNNLQSLTRINFEA